MFAEESKPTKPFTRILQRVLEYRRGMISLDLLRNPLVAIGERTE